MKQNHKTKFKQTEIGMIPEDWGILLAEKCLEKIIDYRGKTPQKTSTGIPLITAKIIKQGHIDFSNCEYIDEKDYDNWMRRGLPNPGDVIFTTEGPLGEVAQLNHQKVALAQRILTLRGKNAVLDNTYLKYYLISPLGQHELNSRATGTTVQGIKQSEFRKIRIVLPCFNEQRSIASILTSLDDKIELNQQINKTLENIGQAIFKHWFVDFEFPNEEGKPYKSSGGEMVDSELGEIPGGWEVERFSDAIAVSPKRSLTKGSLAKKISMADLERWQSWISSWSIDQYRGGSVFQNGDTLFARITPCLEQGKTAFVCCLNENEVAFGSTEFIVLAPKAIKSPSFIFFLSISPKLREDAILSMSGTSGRQRVPNYFFDHFLITLPPDKIVNKFELLINPVMRMININNTQINDLGALRDSLLPKLMSGKIRVNMEAS